MSRLTEAAWTEARRGGTLVVPVGATEQHGPHLPIGTDTLIVEELVERLEVARPEVWIAPTIEIGASGEHAGFAGTLSIGRAALTAVMIEIVRSADAFDGVYFVNWHGGNVASLDVAVTKLSRESRRVGMWKPGAIACAFDLHAGRTETSLMLAIRPDLVRLEEAEAGAGDRSRETLKRLRLRGVRAVSENGVLGDPAGAGAEEGTRLLAELADGLIAGLDEFSPVAGPAGRAR